MRRYRFVEEGLALSKRETETVIAQTRNNHKLWNCLHEQGVRNKSSESLKQYSHIVRSKDVLFFEGLFEMLEEKDDTPGAKCRCRDTCRMAEGHAFGGVQLCAQCREQWRAYLEDLHMRIVRSFPEAARTLRTSRLREGL
jgi:hypothetical protein